MTSSAGGIWQFYQLIAKKIGSDNSLITFAPSLLLEELKNSGEDSGNGISYEALQTSIELTAAYRILEAHAYGQICGVWIPFYQKITRRIKCKYYDCNVIEHEVYKLLQREKIDVIHVPLQHAQMPRVVKRFPYIINPHDFQHEYYPDFFTSDALEFRRTVWYTDQREAAAVVVHSRQTQADVIKYLGIPDERVFYAPYGPLNSFPEPNEEDLEKTIQEFSLPDRFVFYPAHTWPHKNHLILVDAIHCLKKRGIDVNAIFTVADGEYGEQIKERIISAGLEDQIIFIGRVSPEKMGALYRLCTMVIVPSLFEQNAGPVLEAIHFGKAVAVSHIEEIVLSLNGAGLLFDPRSVQEITEVIDKLWSSEETLKKVEGEVRERSLQMNWNEFRDVYQQAYDFAVQ